MTPSLLRSFLKHLVKPFLLALGMLFSFQVVMSNLSLAQCHTDKIATEAGSTAGIAHDDHADHSEGESHSGDLGFCLFGHCHMHHCSVLVTELSVKVSAFIMPNKPGFLKESQLHSILPLEKPWQPPRV
ncbi:hypothetical protein AZI87_17630 [Bdellovibrio bacteriovorus]|uniref:Uncharacterized protein n=1 Tax=Bdellovibrio bacteriovorus TaxID=959 RepID=A0A162FUV2_BDEBC|nr:hypothetical protein [Bdellovibrio bacteriovorus]KYG62343.1 hypothetical protein AZI87_17630 [Bdellovibrio bacteriovorus]